MSAGDAKSSRCSAYIEALKISYNQYQADLQEWQQQRREEEAIVQEGRAAADFDAEGVDAWFAQSPYVEFEGEAYNCINNNSPFACALCSKQHQKCKCQQLYGNRPGLHAPCSQQSTLLNGALTYEYCASNGFLSNGDLPQRMAQATESPLRRAAASVASARREPPRWRPPPFDPACEMCRGAVERLISDWSFETLSAARACAEASVAEQHQLNEQVLQQLQQLQSQLQNQQQQSPPAPAVAPAELALTPAAAVVPAVSNKPRDYPSIGKDGWQEPSSSAAPPSCSASGCSLSAPVSSGSAVRVSDSSGIVIDDDGSSEFYVSAAESSAPVSGSAGSSLATPRTKRSNRKVSQLSTNISKRGRSAGNGDADFGLDDMGMYDEGNNNQDQGAQEDDFGGMNPHDDTDDEVVVPAQPKKSSKSSGSGSSGKNCKSCKSKGGGTTTAATTPPPPAKTSTNRKIAYGLLGLVVLGLLYWYFSSRKTKEQAEAAPPSVSSSSAPSADYPFGPGEPVSHYQGRRPETYIEDSGLVLTEVEFLFGGPL